MKLYPNPITNFKFYSGGSDPIETKFTFTAYGMKRLRKRGLPYFSPARLKKLSAAEEHIQLLPVTDNLHKILIVVK